MSLIGLNTNLASLRAQRRLIENSSALSRSFERLSSGLRINRAGDDAAGLAISQGLNTDARVYGQGVRNLNDGVGVLSVADGALEQLSNIVIRMRELATQAASGTISFTQRKALDQEAQELSKEYTRIIQTTRFNNQLLFSNSFGTLSLQAGYGTNGSIFSTLGGAAGDGTFSISDVNISGGTPSSTALGDFNGDGILDMISGTDSGTFIELHIGNGDGTFQDPTAIDDGAVDGFTVSVGDFNNDGHLDAAAYDGNSGEVKVYAGNGDGTFQAGLSYFTDPTDPSNRNSMTVGDFNGDGNQDLATASDNTDNVSVLFGVGDGSFQAALQITGGDTISAIEAVDVNGDGFDDLVMPSQGVDELSLLISNGDGTFQSATSIPLLNSKPTDVAVGDFNGDGIPDIAVTHQTDMVSIVMGNGDGTFTAELSYSAPQIVEGRQIGVGDFNSDGYLDLIVADASASTIGMLLGQGDGTFSSGGKVNGPGDVVGVTVGDVNGDGVYDFITNHNSAGGIYVYTGDVTSGAAPLQPIDLRYRYSALAAIPVLDQALQRVSQQRGTVGAFLSRIQTGLSNLTQASENFLSAASQITDADVAIEAAELTRKTILQQASSAILAQANLLPQLALDLLGSSGDN